MISKVYNKFRNHGVSGIYDAFRFRLDHKLFKPCRTKLAINNSQFIVNIDDFEAHTWFGKYRYHWVVWPIDEFAWIAQNVGEKDVVYDIGSHQCIWSMVFSRAASGGSVHAFETSRFNSAVAEKNLSDNGIENVVVNNMCMGNEDGIAIVADNSGGVYSLIGESTLAPIEVPMISGDSYAGQKGITPTFLKIDVEGFEVEVLLGLQDVLKSRPTILLELHNFKYPNARDYVESCLALIDLSSYELSLQQNPGTEMLTLDGLGEREIRLIVEGDNPHLYCRPE